MNLLSEPWMPFLCRDGSVKNQPISAIVNSNFVDFSLPRADFLGAAYQFVIGLLQTTFAPHDKKEWNYFFQHAPEQEELQNAFGRVKHAFELDGEGPRFMQDLAPLEEQRNLAINNLLIDAPGENGIKNNTDFFIKRRENSAFSPAMAALALFTLQINAPTGGQGYRVGLRGGGPLTTLVLPQDKDASLWQKLWLNVINRQYWQYDEPNFQDGSVFPWLASTRDSSVKGSEIYPSTPGIHPLHVYWAMPRRIRLNFAKETVICSISGRTVDIGVQSYRAKKHGNNYDGNWDPTPFTPYKWEPKLNKHNPVKGEPGGILYNIWTILTLTDSDRLGQGHVSARVVDHYNSIARRNLPENPRIWVFGYDMDKMKPRGWYSRILPFFVVEDDVRNDFINEVNGLLSFCLASLNETNKAIQSIKGKVGFIDMNFWQRTEKVFFVTVAYILKNLTEQNTPLTPRQAQEFKTQIQKTCEDLFDGVALDELASFDSLGKQMQARGKLIKWLYCGKQVKAFNQNYHLDLLKGK